MTLPFDPPVVLAPMAGITNRAFRRLCRRTGAGGQTGGSAGLYVSEMVTSRALVERTPRPWTWLRAPPMRARAAVQVYGVDPG